MNWAGKKHGRLKLRTPQKKAKHYCTLILNIQCILQFRALKFEWKLLLLCFNNYFAFISHTSIIFLVASKISLFTVAALKSHSYFEMSNRAILDRHVMISRFRVFTKGLVLLSWKYLWIYTVYKFKYFIECPKSSE